MSDRARPDGSSPFHEGERTMQAWVGAEELMAQVGARILRDHMPAQHRELFEKLPYLVVGVVDGEGFPQATMLFGAPGFVSTADERTLSFDIPRASESDPAVAAFKVGRKIGLLGIELSTRRRNRANGRITACSPERVVVAIEQSFGNCPQYIQARALVEPEDGTTTESVAYEESGGLSEEARALVVRADTFFVATASANVPTPENVASVSGDDVREGVDVSHRGGLPGFVRVSDEAGHTRLTFSDFRGNNMYATLGNLLVNPRAGLVFVDFATGTLLSLTGHATIMRDGAELAERADEGAVRLVRFTLRQGVRIHGAAPHAWSAPTFARELKKVL